MRHMTLARQIGFILLLCMLILFAAGLAVMRALENSSLEMLYAQTHRELSSALSEVEERIEAAEQTAYDIIVSGATQSVVSAYWDAYDAGAGQAEKRTYYDELESIIATSVGGNSDILCANLLEADGAVRAIASRKYIKLTDAQASEIEARARAEEGGTLLLQGSAFGLDENTLLVVKQLREKRKLSMRHTGVLVLFLDMDRLGAFLTDGWTGTFALEGEGLYYVLNRSGGAEAFLSGDGLPREDSYMVAERGGVQYYLMRTRGQVFTGCVAVLPYNPMFATERELYTRYTLLFAACCVLVCAAAITLTNLSARDLNRLRGHIRSISGTEAQAIPPLTGEKPRSRDAADLYESFNAMAERINRLIHDNYKAELAAKDAQLSALQAQINPHFLYNTLNAIYWAAKSGENDRAAAMTQDLSLLLRDAVNTSENVVTVDRELEITCTYLRILKQRYRERLEVVFDVDSELSSLAIPKFTIQPLIENAVKYGVDQSLSGGRVDVKLRREGDKCVCLVTNDGPAPDADLSRRIRSGNVVGHGTGIGLVNIDKRIRAMFGDEYGVSVYRDAKLDRTVTRVEFAARPAAQKQEALT